MLTFPIYRKHAANDRVRFHGKHFSLNKIILSNFWIDSKWEASSARFDWIVNGIAVDRHGRRHLKIISERKCTIALSLPVKALNDH